ncbi:MAG: PilZ domain-containing protein [Oscillospiraceae bacterium]
MNLNNILGCMCELKTMDNEFLGIGRISAYNLSDNSLEIVSCDGSSMPSMRYETKVKINVFGSKRGFLGLEGYVYIAHNSFWRLYDVNSLGENERRSYFRIKTNSRAEVEEIIKREQSENDGQEAENMQSVTFPCVVTSVSISGALIVIEKAGCNFRVGSMLQINAFTVGESSQLFTLKCEVKRVENNERLGKLLGCEFTDLNDNEIQSLCQAIFAQQRLEIHRKKGFH